MGSGCSHSKNQVTATGTPTKEQWEEITGESVGDEFSEGAWWWGHPNGPEKPADANQAIKLMTAGLPAYYQDILLLKHCPSYLDAQAWGKSHSRCPFVGGTGYMGHEDVSRLLSECPREHIAGKIKRGNELGYLVLTDQAFKRSGNLGIGNEVGKHHKQRSAMVKLLINMPKRHGWLKEIHTFLRGRNKIDFPTDIYTWWTQMLWSHVLQVKMSWEEAVAFNEFRDHWLRAAVVHMGDLSLANLTFTMDDMNKEQDSYWEKIKTLLPDFVPAEDVADVAQAVLEMFCFAGGLSVPQTITSAVAALYQDFMPQPVSEENVTSFVYEVTRLFPAVQGFAWWRDDHRHIASLNGALRDPKVWGPDANKFTLKDVKLYKEKHVGFADSAIAENENDSKYCPGRDVALDSVQAFVLALGEWAPKGERLGAIWRPVNKIATAGKPNWWKSFTLEKVQGRQLDYYEELLNGDTSGEEELRNLSPQQFQALMSKIDADSDGVPDAIGEMDIWTRIMYKSSKGTWRDNSHIDNIDLPYEPARPYTDEDSFLLPLGNIRMPTSDEQWTGEPWFQSVALAVFGKIEKWTSDDVSESLQVFTQEHRQEAIAMAQQAFFKPGGGSYLPITKSPWAEVASDEAQALIARFGFGQLFLKRNSNPNMAEYGEVMCDVSLLASYPVRPAFERLGAVAYFKWEPDGAPSITAIDWKHGDRVVTPDGGKEWEHAKYAWRCSIGTAVTAVHHLVWSHWIVANAVTTSIRETLSPDHPIRRVLHIHTYNTASINSLSFTTLYSENGVLHHLCPLTHEGLKDVFNGAVDMFEFKTWPQVFESFDLPDELKQKLPIFEDGLPLWTALHEFYSKYIDLYYENDEAIQADKQLQLYWRFRCAPPYSKSLPPLSKSTLSDQITQAVFDVTAYHEFVGNVVGYLGDPQGMFMQVREGCDMADKQHMIQTLSLCASTGSPMPRFIDDWSSMLDLGSAAPVNHFQKAKELWEQMRKSLLDLSTENCRRNEGRPQAFSQFDPKYLECSVSL